MGAEELRKAAETLRTRAEAATDGGFGWHVADHAGANEVWADRDAAGWDAFMIATTATRLNPNPGVRGAACAIYIATVDPRVGLALADWLDSEFAHDFRPSEHAIEVARQINGGAA